MIPSELERLINIALDEIRRDQNHEMNPRLRLAIIEAFGPEDSMRAQRARGWLAIITAQKVLSIFQQSLPEEGNPEELIEMAKAVVRGELDHKEAGRLASEGCELAGRLWGYDEAKISFKVQIAGNVGYRALYEASGWNLLSEALKTTYTYEQGSEPARLIDRGDIALSQQGGDTASAAAVAYACIDETGKIDSQMLLNHWEWWLTEAISSAWKLSRGSE